MEGRKGRRPIEYCYWVVPARFLAGEYPRTYEDRSSRRKLSALLDAGITRFIDLTEEGELKPYAPMLASLSDGTVRYERFAIPDTQVPESMGLTRAILDSIDAEMASGGRVYLHCWGGIGRTGTIVGCWLARQGTPGRAALEELARLWRDNPKSHWASSPENDRQARYVEAWREPATT